MRFGSVGGVHEAGQGGPYLEVRQPQPGDSFGRRAIGRIVNEGARRKPTTKKKKKLSGF